MAHGSSIGPLLASSIHAGVVNLSHFPVEMTYVLNLLSDVKGPPTVAYPDRRHD